MLKFLQVTAILFLVFFTRYATFGQASGSRERVWVPASTDNSAPSEQLGSPSGRRQVPASLRALSPSQMRGTRAVRATSLQSSQTEAEVDEIEQTLEEGNALMAQKRWLDAKKCFGQGLRDHPNNLTLLTKYAEARRRQEIEIRYEDGAFAALTSNSTLDDVLGVFNETFQDVERYHVDCPAYSQLFRLGMAGVEEALTEEAFFERYLLPEKSRDAAKNAFEELKPEIEGLSFSTVDEVRNAVLRIARRLKQRSEVPETATISEFLCSAICSLDAYSSPLTPIQVEDVFSLIDGRFVGIGVELKTNAPTKIARVIQGSPADEAGIAVGDEIIRVDGKDARGLTGAEIGELLQGREGEIAELLLRSPSGNERTITATRRPIDVPSVENVEVLDKGGEIGYFKITCFQKTTASELIAAVNRLSKRGVKSLVVDLRQNPGGLLQEAINVSDVFLDGGIIVQTHGRNGYHSFQAKPGVVCALPLTLIIDSDSASAAEIFAGAMQENGRAVVIGTQSYGKGTVQAIVQLNLQTLNKKPIAGLRLTTEKFYSPKGRAYAGVGVIPDVDVDKSQDSRAKDAETSPVYAGIIEAEEADSKQGYVPVAAKKNRAAIDSDPFLSTAVREALKQARAKVVAKTISKSRIGDVRADSTVLAQ